MANSWLRRCAFSAGLLLAGLAAAEAERLPFAYQARYRIEHDGMAVGHLNVDLQPVGGSVWRYHSATEPKGLFSMFSGTRVDGTYLIRCAILSFRTHLEHVDEAVDALLRAVERT